MLLPAASDITRNCRALLAMTSSVWQPIEPVDPKMATPTGRLVVEVPARVGTIIACGEWEVAMLLKTSDPRAWPRTNQLSM